MAGNTNVAGTGDDDNDDGDDNDSDDGDDASSKFPAEFAA